MLPLTIKQTKSMQEMKRIQPKLKELQEKHKGNKEKLQEEIMKFYAEHKINPLSGCLPLLLQLPIMFALFRVLQGLGKGEIHGFLSIMKDISLSPGKAMATLGTAAAAPYFVLILFMVITTYVPSKMMSTDPQQDRIMLFMTVFMGYIGWNLPAGVLLYLIISNGWTVGQQYISIRGARGAAAVEGG